LVVSDTLRRRRRHHHCRATTVRRRRGRYEVGQQHERDVA